MSLVKRMKKGVKLIGLESDMIVASGVVGGNQGMVSKGVLRCSYDFNSPFIGADTITFHRDTSGAYPITILPYYPGGINNTPFNGQEVLSGPFTGCYFSMFLDSGGTLRCAHVDTAQNSENKKPSEEAWQKMAYEIINERKTTVDDDLFNAMTKKKLGANDGFVIGIAAPDTQTITLFNVIKQGDTITVLNVVK